mmetsp:Transcript_58358/g.115695  ORF Transcript_58358/g.115695 Transcript_58358/m.115695 type:complete len:159 (+) Transcript_58358:427-903(+)
MNSIVAETPTVCAWLTHASRVQWREDAYAHPIPRHDDAASCLGILVRIGLSIAHCGARSRGSVGGPPSSAGIKFNFASTGRELLASLAGTMGLLTSSPPGQHRGEYVLPRPAEGAVLKLSNALPFAACIGVLEKEATAGSLSLGWSTTACRAGMLGPA